jgi:hypothetical protein
VTEALQARGIFFFALRVLGWSLVVFALWYFAARPVSMGVAWAAAELLPAGAPVERARPRWKPPQVVFDVELDGATTYRNRLRPDAVFEVALNPLKQTFGLPFFLALLLASRPPRLAAKAALGAAVLLALAAFGVACEVAINLGALVAPGGGALVEFNAFRATFAALGYQLGTLIFPTVVPAMLWVAMDPRYMSAAAHRMGPDSGPA